MKKTFLLLSAMLFSVIFSGCAGNFEIDRELIVEAAGVDFENGLICLTLQTLDAETHPAGEMGSSDGKITAILTATGKTVTEAVEKIASEAGREPVFSQTRVVALGGGAMIEEGAIRRFLDMFIRSYQLRNDSYLVCARSAKELVGAEIGSGKIPAVRLQSILEAGGKSGACVPISLYEFENLLNDLDAGEFIPMFSLNEKKEPSPDGTAVFRDGSPAAFLDNEETRILALLTRRANDGTITGEYDGNLYSFTLLRSRPGRKQDDGGTRIDVRCLCDTAEIFGKGVAQTAKARDAIGEAERELSVRANELLEKLYEVGARLPGDRGETAPKAAFRIRLRK